MRLLVDIYDAAGERLGDGPITTAISASVTRVLDGAGSISIDFPDTDARAHELIAVKRRAHLLVDHEDGTPLREAGRLIIEKSKLKQSKSGFTRSIDGPDTLGELKFTNVRRGRVFNGQTVQGVVDSLLALTTGWARSGAAAGLVSARFDGASILKALVALVEQQGLHFRQNPLYSVEIGSFGSSNGLTVVNRETAPAELYANDDILLIDALTLEEDSEDIVNWLEPVGAGEGDAAITLEKAVATRSVALGYAYDIQTEAGPDGRTVYYLKDQASINAYGQVELVGDFNQIVPVGTSEADQVAIAEALYDAAVAHLTRYKDPYVAYGLTARKTRQNLLPGDRIRLQDKFRVVDDQGVLVDVIDVDGDFWIMEVSESFGVGGNPVQLKIASIDRVQMGEAEVVVGAIESISISNLSVRGYFSHYAWETNSDIDPFHSVTFQINLTERTQSLTICTLRLVTAPFRSNAKNLPHYHQLWSTPSGAVYAGAREAYQVVGVSAADGTGLTNFIVDYPVTDPDPVYTWGAAGAQEYGIFDDSDYPQGLTVFVDGISVISGLDNSGVGLDETFDITPYILLTPPLQQPHSIRVECGAGQGQVKALIEVFEVIQSVSVF